MSQEQEGNQEAVEVTPSDNQGLPNVPDVGGDEDFQRDIAAIAAEQGLSVGDDGVQAEMPVNEPQDEPEPEQPTEERETEEAPATQEESTPEVPEKFQKEDGSVDAEKVRLSTEAALARYEELQKKLGKVQNEVNQQQSTPTEPQQPVQQSLNASDEVPLDNMAKQIEDEIKLNGTGVALAKLMNIAHETAYKRAKADISGIEGSIENQKQQAELRRIAEQDDWVLSEKGFDVLSKVRQENPWVDNSPTPWKTALELAKGRGLAPSNSKTQSSSGKSNPKPEGTIVTPPSGTRVASTPKSENLASLPKAELFAKLDKMSEKDQDAFWRAQGVPVWHK
jgi:hypothetical protein